MFRPIVRKITELKVQGYTYPLLRFPPEFSYIIGKYAAIIPLSPSSFFVVIDNSKDNLKNLYNNLYKNGSMVIPTPQAQVMNGLPMAPFLSNSFQMPSLDENNHQRHENNEIKHNMAGPRGFEPRIFGSEGRRLILARLRAHKSLHIIM